MVLNFTKLGKNAYVSDNIAGGATNTAIVHLAFQGKANVTVERTIAEDDGYVPAAATEYCYRWEDTITGIAEGQKVRIKCNMRPLVAVIFNV